MNSHGFGKNVWLGTRTDATLRDAMPLLLVSETFTQIGMALDRARTLAAAGRQVHEWIERDRSRAFIATA